MYFLCQREIRHFHVVVVRDGKEMYKKAWCTCKIVVLLIKPIVFVAFPLPSLSLDLKVPNEEKTYTSHGLSLERNDWGRQLSSQKIMMMLHLKMHDTLLSLTPLKYTQFAPFWLQQALRKVHQVLILSGGYLMQTLWDIPFQGVLR